MADLRVCVIGLGYFSQFHLEAWQKIATTQIVGVSDLSPDRRAWAEQEFGVQTFDDVAAMLETCKPDIVDIVTPPPAHAALVRLSLQKDRTLICQKPFCVDLEEATQITAEAKTKDVPIVIHENFRFQPWYRAVKAFLETGQMGQIYRAHFALRPGDGRGPDAYLSRQPAFQTMPKLLIHETGVHFIDLFRWLLGPVTDVYADLRRLNPAIAGEDAGLLVLDHASGAQSILDGNRLSDHQTDQPRRTMGEFELEGESGTLRLDGTGQLTFRAFGDQTWTNIALSEPVDDTRFGGGCVEALCRHVAHAIQSGTQPENLAAEYLEVLRIERAAYQSDKSRTKLPVSQR